MAAPTDRDLRPPPEDDAARLVELVAQALDRIESDGPSALDELCARHPRHAQALRERVGRLARVGLGAPAPAESAAPERLGGFKLLARIGGGGMGVVHLAEQEGLGRRVALKLVRPEQLWFPGARERFRREVAALARLAHPGIVPVYAGGEDGGVPYLAMELVRGATLEEALAALSGREPARLAGSDLRAAVRAAIAARDAGGALGQAGAAEGGPVGDAARPARVERDSTATGEAALRLYGGSWSATCLRIARQVAEALQHAHEHGVLHRDVKPSNVMLTPDGRVLLLDFGLATGEGSERLTGTGSHLGSLAWMSPEQVRGEHAALDARTDVYSLGATLYELLTLRSPYASGDSETTRARILDGRPLPIRELNTAVPRDAETVCLKAMDRDRARRYAGAADFAADLANALELRPVAARRLGALLTARRWAQRRPAAATGIVLGALLAVAGPVGWQLNQRRNARELQESFERSERDFGAALSAIGSVLRESAVEDLEDVPRMQRARLASIEAAMKLFVELERDRPDDVRVLDEGAALHAARGDVLRDVGRPDEARAEFLAAAALHRRRLANDPTPERRERLSAALNLAGKASYATLRADEALPFYDEAVELLRGALADAPDHAERRRFLALTLSNRAEAQLGRGEPQAAARDLDEARVLMDALAEERPDDPAVLWTRARVLSDLCDLARQAGEDAAALRHAQDALAGHRAASAAAPGSRYEAFDVTTGLRQLALVLVGLRRQDEAEPLLHEALDLVEGLLRDFPESARYQRQRIELLDVLAISAGRAGRHEEARELLLANLAHKERLADSEPDRCDYALDAAQSLGNVANTLVQRHERLEEALALLERCERRVAACVSAEAAAAVVRRVQGQARYLRALTLCLLDRDEARAAVEAWAGLAGSDPGELRYAADLWNEWILSVRRARPEGAERAAAEAEGRAAMYALLHRALDAGYDDRHELESTAALDAFRDDPEFVALLARLPAPEG